MWADGRAVGRCVTSRRCWDWGTSLDVLSWMKYWWSCPARWRVWLRKWLSSSAQVHTVFLTIGHLFVVYTHTTNLWPPSPQLVWPFWRLPCLLFLLLFRRRPRNGIWESPSCLFLSNIYFWRWYVFWDYMEFSLTDANVVQIPFVLSEFPFLQGLCAGWMPMKHLNRKVLFGPWLTTGPKAGFTAFPLSFLKT